MYYLYQARSCLYASTQLNPHYFDKKFFFSKVRLAVKCRLVEINESKAIHLHFYAKINGFSLVKKALRMPQNAPNCTIYFKIFRHDPWPPRLFWIHILYRLATRLICMRIYTFDKYLIRSQLWNLVKCVCACNVWHNRTCIHVWKKKFSWDCTGVLRNVWIFDWSMHHISCFDYYVWGCMKMKTKNRIIVQNGNSY